MALDLKGKQLQVLRDALVRAFPSYSDLQMMLLFELNEDIGRHVPIGPMDKVATDLILWARSQSRLDELIAGARAQNPTNLDLRQFALEISVTSDEPPKGKLEAMVLKNVPFQKVAQWRDQMAKVEKAVCRVELPEGTGMGTGFLIGPSAILTNWHVAKLLEEQNLKPEQAGVRFDYAADASGVAVPAGKFYRFVSDYIVDKSPETELDFALLKVEGAPGNEAIGPGDQTRGWLSYQPHEFEIGEIQFILQHQLAAPLNLSAGAVTAINSLHKRVTYTANTDFGSSGSPVFTIGWKIAALHHWGEQTGNMGIPLNYIWEQLEADKKLSALEK